MAGFFLFLGQLYPSSTPAFLLLASLPLRRNKKSSVQAGLHISTV